MSTEMVETNADVRRHELLADVAEQIAKRLIKKHSMDPEAAGDIGNDMADFLSEHWKGQNIYITADAPFKLSQRDVRIYSRMRRGNAHEIAKEEGISYVRVYQIYKRCLAAARSRTQPALFEDPDLEDEVKLSTGEKTSESSQTASE